MRKSLVVFAALAVIGFTAPAFAQDDNRTAPTRSLLLPESLAQAVATVQSRQADIAELDKRIASARRGISRGKKMVLWGSGILAGGLALAVLSATDSCLNSDNFQAQLVPKGCSAGEYAGVYTGAAGMSIAIFGGKNWVTNTFRLRRAEAEKQKLVGVSATPTSVAANYRLSW